MSQSAITTNSLRASPNESGTGLMEQVAYACREYQIASPSFQIVSDRRGGRTAWSSRVTVNGAIHQARFWYDGKNLNNAKEDAAEVALSFISMAASPSASRRW
ncbi:hypothetical protein INS49_009383 [Diaporthe citri]|uniref:uncharacterized protein n=1 Tax=Diaporthe citri TaxID=83186 RepID=UPI001C817812|nr:uncharacterized protein INS49_009383 [Diaporthe citri]KAG6361159.1 hypothetical protein INS49_009383 [Diaporthe citri]